MPYICDTNVILYHLRDEEAVRTFIDERLDSPFPLYLSVVSETELLRWPQLPDEEEAAILELLPIFSIVPLDSNLARKAGRIGRLYNLKLGDSIIAATAQFTGSILVTRNVRDFKRVPDLHIQPI